MIHPELEILQRVGLIAPLEDAGRYQFRHALIQDAAYESLLRQDRRRLHHIVATSLEQLEAERIDELAAVLAQHFAAAGEHERAVAYYLRAAQRAVDTYANDEAQALYEQALPLAEDVLEQAHIYAGIGETTYRRGQTVHSEEHWLKAMDLYRSLGNTDRQALAAARASRSHWETGQPEGALALCEQAYAELKDAPHSPGLADLIHELGRSLFFLGRPAEAEPILLHALEMGRATGTAFVQAQALTTLALLPGKTSDQRIAAYLEAIELAETTGHTFPAIRAHNNLGETLCYHKGALQQGLDHLLCSSELSLKTGRLGWGSYTRMVASEIQLWLGQIDIIEPLLPNAERFRVGLLSPNQAALLLMEATYTRQRGDLPTAERLARSLYERTKEQREVQYMQRSAILLAELLLEQGQPTEVEELLMPLHAFYKEALGWGVIWCQAAQARAAVQLGELERAEGLLAQLPSLKEELGLLDIAAYAEASADLLLARGARVSAQAEIQRAIAAEQAAGRPWYAARLMLRLAALLDDGDAGAALAVQAARLCPPGLSLGA